MKEEVDALPEQENNVPYHEDDFMFIFSDDKHENMILLSELYSSECTRIEQLSICREEKRQLHDILNIMTRSMSKSKKADVPDIYPLKGEHRKPEHAKPQEVQKQIVVEQVEQEHADLVEPADSDEIELQMQNEVPLQVMPQKVHD